MRHYCVAIVSHLLHAVASGVEPLLHVRERELPRLLYVVLTEDPVQLARLRRHPCTKCTLCQGTRSSHCCRVLPLMVSGDKELTLLWCVDIDGVRGQGVDIAVVY